MKCSGWGNYPVIDASVVTPQSRAEFQQVVIGAPVIAQGLGRSYGDSALAEHIINTRYADRYLTFNSQSGALSCEAGVSLASILDVFVPKGWFLPVTPGTKFVSVGGAIASDVHGKNHHGAGCFSEFVDSINLLLPSGEVKTCSRSENTDLFLATCGGQGLTGIILQATLRLLPIKSSTISQRTLKTANLQETIDVLLAHGDTTYSVAWIDCLSQGEHMGRSLVMLGEHDDQGELTPGKPPKLSVPIAAPSFCINRFSMRLFNSAYYNRVSGNEKIEAVHYDPYFYPLDAIGGWNKLYGKQGFTQYQCVLPTEAASKGMHELLGKISQSQKGSFLSVLKVMGKQNDNLLSFPIEGLTLALDFKMEAGLLALLDQLDEIVLAHGGRLYLTKDARMSEQTFKTSYPRWEQMAELRAKYQLENLQSLQAKRLGL